MLKFFIKSARMVIIISFLAMFLLSRNAMASQKNIYRIGYIEAGEYWTYTSTLGAIKKALETSGDLKRLGWKGKKAEFPKDAHYSPGWDNEKQLIKDAKTIMNRKDLDLIISAGTAATAAILKANNGSMPILGVAVADAVKSKFVINENDSGVDNFTVRIVPGRYKRMFQIFHDVVGFKKLGLIYPDTKSGRQYCNIDDAHQVAKKRGFEIIEYNKIGPSESTEDCLKGIKFLIGAGMEAFFIPPLNCFDWEKNDVKMLLDLLVENKLPTFAREGSKMVKSGALMGFSTYDFTARGLFLAERIVRILLGEKPRSLPMVDNAIPKISLNLQVAELIGFDPSFDIIAASDEIFQEITLPENRKVK